MSLILAIEPDAAQADAVRRAVRSLPGVDLVLVESRDAALSILKGRVPEMVLLSALLGPSDEAALTTALRTAPGAGHVEMITIPLLEHGPGFDEGRRGLFGVFGRRKVSNEVRIKSGAFAAELRAHLDRIAETLETHALTKHRQQRASAMVALEEQAAENLEHVPPARSEWAGPSDTFGEREFSVDDQGRAVEVLRLSRDFAETRDSVSDRIVRLMAVDRAALAQALRLDTEAESGRPILLSERVGGVRLSALLERASERLVVADLPAALFVMRRLLKTAAAVYARTGIAHLAIAPERTVVTARAEIVIVEAALAAAIEARSFSIDAASPSRDLRQIALIGLSVMLGRPVPTDADLNARTMLVNEAIDVATIRVGEPFAEALRTWFDRALAADERASFPDFSDAASALAAAGSSQSSGSVALRRTLRTFLEELGAPGGPDDPAIEAARIRVARAKQISHRGMYAAVPATETYAEPAETFIEPAAPTEAIEPLDDHVAAIVKPETSIFRTPPPVVEPPPPPAPADTRRPTLLELFRTARSSDEDTEPMTASIFADRTSPPAEEPAATQTAPSGFEGSVLREAEEPAEEFASVPLVEAPGPSELEAPAVSDVEVQHAEHFADVADTRSVEESAEAAPEPVVAFHADVEPVVEPIVAPAEEPPPALVEEPEPPPVERRRPSILELFRATRPAKRAQEADSDADTTSILRLHEPVSEPAGEAAPEQPEAEAIDTHEPEPVADEPPAIFTAPIAFENVAPEPEPEPAYEPAPIEPIAEPVPVAEEPLVEAAPPATDSEAEASAEEPARPRKASLLDFLRSTRFGRGKREREQEAAPPPPPMPEPEPEPAAEPEPEAPAQPAAVQNEPLNDIFAELIQAARAVTPASAKRKRKTDPVVPEPEPEPESVEPEAAETEPVEEPVAAEAVEDEWTTDPVEVEPAAAEPAAIVAEPATDDSDWGDWSVPETAQASAGGQSVTEPEPEQPLRGEKFRLPDEDEWPTWNALESTSAQPAADHETTPEQEVAADHEALEQDEPAVVEPAPVEEQKEEDEDVQQWSVDPVEPPPAAPPEKRRRPSLLEAFRSSRAEESFDSPQSQPAIPAPAEPSIGPSVDEVAAQFDAFEKSARHSVPPPPADVPAYGEIPAPPPPVAIPLEEPKPTPTYAAPPPLAPDPEPPTYVAPPPAPAPPPLGFSPTIGIESLPRPVAAPRPAEFSPQPSQTFKGPVTRKSAPARRQRGWAPVVGATLALACLAIAGRAYYFSAPAQQAAAPEEIASKPTTVNAKGTGSVAVSSEPTGARVTVDGKPRGVTPITIANLRPGTHKVVLDSSAGTVRREVKIVAGREATLDETIYAGWVAVYAPFELQISEGSRVLGTTENQIMLAPGRHQLELTNRQLGYHESRGIDVTPGETTTINIKAAEGIVRINAPDGAEVWIDGERVGQTPLGDLRVAVGARDIVVRHPDLGEQHTVANVTIGARAEVTIDFRRPKGD